VAEDRVASRRTFLARMSAGLGAMAAMLVAIPALGLLLSPARRDAQLWRPVGPVTRFRVGETVLVAYVDPEPLPWAGFAARSTAWVRRDGPDTFVAFSPYCTHVGCPVTWAAGAELFMCPCHGGTFHRDGSVAAGPPPRPLDRLAVRVRDGQVEVYTRGLPVAE
jgi:menaquinol-cytochrome c reductase iron-sulfur subunit